MAQTVYVFGTKRVSTIALDPEKDADMLRLGKLVAQRVDERNTLPVTIREAKPVEED
jgi:hypothetical protein